MHFVWTSSQNIDRIVTIFRAAKKSGRVLLIDLYTAVVLEGAGFSYSMWEGHLKEDSSRRVLDWLDRHGIEWQVLHTSGHASTADLQRFAAALAPQALVPIHSLETGRFPEFFNNVVPRVDGEWWDI